MIFVITRMIIYFVINGMIIFVISGMMIDSHSYFVITLL